MAVIGAGIMGRGIAHAAALGGYRTILEDILPNALRKAETEIRANLDKAVELGKVSWPTRNQLIRYTGVVLGLCLFFAIYLGALDSGFAWILGRLVGR